MLCRTKTLLVGPIGTEAARIRSPPTDGRNSPESKVRIVMMLKRRPTLRTPAEIAEVPLKARIFCLI